MTDMCSKQDCNCPANSYLISSFQNVEHRTFGCKDHFMEIVGQLMKSGHAFLSSHDIDNHSIEEKQPEKQPEKQGATINKFRAMVDEADAKANGFILAPPIFALGTPVNQIGVDNFKKSRQEFEKLPKTGDAVETFVHKVNSEKRTEAVIPLNSIIMLPDGRVTRRLGDGVAEGGYYISRRALTSLIIQANVKNASYFEQCPPVLRAHNVNYWMAVADSESQAKFRLRTMPDISGNLFEEIFAVVSPKYAIYDSKEISKIVSELVSDDSRTEIVYDGTKTKINVIFHSDIKAENAVAGEIFKSGITVSTDDSGMGSMIVKSFVIRNLCKNLIIIDVATQEYTRRRHIGNTQDIEMVLREGIAKAHNSVATFASRWGFAVKESLIENTIDIENTANNSSKNSLTQELFMAGLFNGLIERELVLLPGQMEKNINGLMEAWQKEPEPTKAGLVNAITRFAHEGEHKNIWVGDQLEEQAGNILFYKKPLPWKMIEE